MCADGALSGFLGAPGIRRNPCCSRVFLVVARVVPTPGALLGKQRRRLITGRRLREIALAGSALPEWLFDECYRHVGDTAETIALLWEQGSAAPAGEGQRDQPLHVWMGHTLPALAALEGAEQAGAVQRLWSGLEPGELLVLNKLLTGGFRVGVAQGLVLRALAEVSGLEESLLAHRLMGASCRLPRASGL